MLNVPKTNLEKTFRENVKRAMQKKGVTHADLAERIGSKPPSVTRLLNSDEGITLARASRIAEALGANPIDLLTISTQ